MRHRSPNRPSPPRSPGLERRASDLLATRVREGRPHGTVGCAAGHGVPTARPDRTARGSDRRPAGRERRRRRHGASDQACMGEGSMDVPGFLTVVAQASLSLPTVDLPGVFLRLVALLPLIGGYMVAREGRGNLGLEIIAVILLVLATIIPPSVSMTSLPSLGPAIVDRLPAVLLLLGLAFVRDGGFKMIIGLALLAISGLILLPQTP